MSDDLLHRFDSALADSNATPEEQVRTATCLLALLAKQHGYRITDVIVGLIQLHDTKKADDPVSAVCEPCSTDCTPDSCDCHLMVGGRGGA